ncbi:MAG: citramalate synthase [Candidatus Caenarcaniphilales bacterium]|nr:citramalate synthase [Candidatus Caenarcaniphilales bacterium]
MKNHKIQIYDTTLRDGSQMHGISFSVADKLKIVSLLDELGVDYIEGGWPGANPKDIEFFQEVKNLKLKNSQIVAFGSTKRVDSENCDEDPILEALIKAETSVVTIVGKTWDLHVEQALRTTLDNNLKLISDSIEHLKSKKRRVIFDAEHFFDGYEENPDYSLKVLETAIGSGVDVISLCDTNGGSLPTRINEIVKEVVKKFPRVQLGIHAHNDGDLAIANSLAAVESGAVQVQGTINGYGERCGNADLISVIGNLCLKMNCECLPSKQHLTKLTQTSHSLSEIANLNPRGQHPFVGRFAFTHKGGLHASAMLRNRETYEHTIPDLVGNKSRIVVSEQAGLSNVIDFAEGKGIELGKNSQRIAKELLIEIKAKEHEGYQFEQAGASLELLFLKKLDKKKKYYEIIDFRVFDSYDSVAEASVQIRVGEKVLHTASLGVGPGHALDNALRKALRNYYEVVADFKLTDFKVRVVDSHDGTAAKTRVNVEMDNQGSKWNTVGLHEDILQATFQAISESIEYGLYKANVDSQH